MLFDAVINFLIIVLGSALVLLISALLVSRLCCLLYVYLGKKKPTYISEFLKMNGSGGRINEQAHPVRYCTAERFQKSLRFLPWDGEGIFIVRDKSFEFRGKLNKGEELAWEFPKNDSFITYVPKSFYRDGGLSWFEIEYNNRKHYFASFYALPRFDNTLTTTGVYEMLSDCYINPETTTQGG